MGLGSNDAGLRKAMWKNQIGAQADQKNSAVWPEGSALVVDLCNILVPFAKKLESATWLERPHPVPPTEAIGRRMERFWKQNSFDENHNTVILCGDGRQMTTFKQTRDAKQLADLDAARKVLTDAAKAKPGDAQFVSFDFQDFKDYRRKIKDAQGKLAHYNGHLYAGVQDWIVKSGRQNYARLIIAPYESDAQMVYMCETGLVDFVVSEDSDLMCYSEKTSYSGYSSTSATIPRRNSVLATAVRKMLAAKKTEVGPAAASSLPSVVQLLPVLATVLGTDYTRHLGLATKPKKNPRAPGTVPKPRMPKDQTNAKSMARFKLRQAEYEAWVSTNKAAAPASGQST